jgi:hypothetical protein
MKRDGVSLGRILTTFLLPVGIACAEGRETGEMAAVRDSAGIEIVELSTTAWERFPSLALVSSPDLSIGAAEGAEEELLYRVSGGTVLADGRVVVLNGGSREVRFYGADGALLIRQGRTGEGPGEYRQLSAVWSLPGDSVVVWDARLLRVTVLAPNGVVARETPIWGRLMATQVRGVLADGSLVLFQQRMAEEQNSMDQQFMGYYSRLSPNGDSLNALGEFPWMRMITTPPTGGGAGPRLVESGPPVFDAETEVAVTAHGLWVGTTKSNEVLWLASNGQVRRVLRWEGTDRFVTEQIKDAYYAELRERLVARSSGESVPEVQRGRPFADELPSHGDLVARADGGLWVQEFPVPGTDRAAHWRAFNSEGLPEGKIEIPPDSRVLWVGPERVLLLEQNELDVQFVRLYSYQPGTDAR